MQGLRTLVLLAAAVSTTAVVYRPHISLTMKNTTLRWKSKARLDGPNVCAKETIWEPSPKTYDVAWTGGSSCYPTSIQMECCDGWFSVPGERGCPQVGTLSSAESAGDRVRAGWWLRLLTTAGLNAYLQAADQTVTVFAPVTSAATSLNSHTKLLLEQGAQSAYRLVDSPQLLLSHVVPGRIRTDSLQNNQILTTMSSHLPIRVNVFPNGLITANCVPILSRDVSSDGPVIQTLTDFLPQTYRFALTDTLLRDTRARRFASLLAQSHMETRLREDGPFTLLIPSDAAIEALGPHYSHALRYDEAGLKALVLNHVLNGVHCSAMFSDASLVTQQRQNVRAVCRRSNTYLQDAKIVEADVMATNGVIHTIDRVLVPRRAMLMPDLLKNLGLTTFAGLIERAGLSAIATSPDAFTLFAPSNSALQGHYGQLNATEAGIFVMNHMAPGRLSTTSFKHLEQISTRGSRLPFTLRNLCDKILVDAAIITSSDVEGLNGVVHVIDRPLLPPRRKSIIQWLNEDGRYSEFVHALRSMQPSLYTRLDVGNNEKFTLFAVGDSYITNRYNFYYDSRILNNHILNRPLVSEEVPANGRVSATTVSNGQLLLARRGVAFMAGSTHVLHRDILCTNGVIHIVRDVILDPRHY